MDNLKLLWEFLLINYNPTLKTLTLINNINNNNNYNRFNKFKFLFKIKYLSTKDMFKIHRINKVLFYNLDILILTMFKIILTIIKLWI